jgi:hypothetical protein
MPIPRTVCSAKATAIAQAKPVPECLTGLLPDLGLHDALEVSAVHSLAGFHLADEFITRPPYSDPHHSASVASIVVGGQRMAKPGAISCAHRGFSSWTTPQKPNPSARDASAYRLAAIGRNGVHQRSTRLAWRRRPIGCSAAGPVVAASSDPVISAWPDPVYGNIATLRHSGRVSTHYGDLASIDAKIRPGATVVVSARY